MIAALVPVLVPVVVAILVGVIWGKRGKPVDPGRASQLILNVGTPCLIFSTLSTLSVAPTMLGKMALAAVLLLAGFLLIGPLLLKAINLPRGVYLLPVVFGNLGNLGLPLSLFAFGPQGLEMSLIMFATQSVLFFTLGMWLMSGHSSPLMMAKTPHPYAIAVALAFSLTGTIPPAWLTNTTELLGGMTIPLMLIMLGVSLTRMHVTSYTRPLLLAVVRLAGGIALAFAISWVLGLDGVARGVVTIACCMPGAVFNYLMAVRFDRSPGEVASYVVISTVAILVLLPVLVPIAWWTAGSP
jgi:malate permease and related proteins